MARLDTMPSMTFVIALICLASFVSFVTAEERTPVRREVARLLFLASAIALFVRA